MMWRELLARRKTLAVRDLMTAHESSLREGKAHERVRLYEAAITAVRRWVRPQADVALDNARDYECAARDARLAAEREVQCVVCTLVQDYHAALDALATIGAGHEHDPTETANRALDGAAARMARFDDTALPPAPTLDITMGVDANDCARTLKSLRDTIRQFGEPLRATDNGTVVTEAMLDERGRNTALFHLARQWHQESPETWEQRVWERNWQFAFPLSEREVRRIIKAVLRYAERETTAEARETLT